MKNFLIFLAVAFLGYAGYRYWKDHRPPPAVVVAPTPTPTPTGPRLAADGTYFLLDYFGVHTDRGIIGWTPGQQVKAVKNGKEPDEGKVWVSDGKLQAQIDLAFLTRDIDLAERLFSSDSAAQAGAMREALAARDRQAAEQKREKDETAMADARAGRTNRTRPVYVAASTPSNPLERAAKPTNGGRQVSAAPDIYGRTVIIQSTPSR